MNMIPLVRATEPGKAQPVNLRRLSANCGLEAYHQCRLRHKSYWKIASERVRIPYMSEVLRVRCAFLESRTLDVVR